MAGFLRQCLSPLRAATCILAQTTQSGSSWVDSAKFLMLLQPASHFHTSTTLNKKFKIEPKVPKEWPKYNDIVYPPSEPGEPRRPAEVCHFRPNIKYSYKKLWYLASMIRGMSIDEALKQMSFHKRNGSAIIKEILEEAQEMAVNEHNVEYKSNLWVADSNVGKGITIKGYRKHRGPRYGLIHYRYTHYFVRLREGPPPKHYYPPEKTGWEKMDEYLKEQRDRRIIGSL